MNLFRNPQSQRRSLPGAVHGEGRDIHSACTQVADEPENIENVAAVGLVDMALQSSAQHE